MASKLAFLQKVTGIGGTEQHFLELGQGLVERGWECHFGVIQEQKNPVPDYVEQLRDAGWQPEVFSINRHFSFGLTGQVKDWLKEIEPALLNTHLIHGDLYGALATRGLNVNLVTTKHNDDAFKNFPGYSWFARLLNDQFDRGIVISEHLKKFYETDLKVKNPEFKRIHYGLDPDKFMGDSRPEEVDLPLDKFDFCFGMVARLTEQKGHTDLLEAFARVTKRQPDTGLVLVGEGPLRDRLEEMVAEFGLENNVLFTGFRSDISSLLPRFDAFVHPSRWEGFGLVFLEAMAAQLPVIGTRISAIPEIVQHEETGLLVEPEAPEKLAGAMTTFLDSPEAAKEMGRAGFERLKDEFTVEEMVAAHDNFYRELTGAEN